jgi:hypothetical protein
VSLTPIRVDRDTLMIEPGRDLAWIEPKKVAPLDERNAPFGDETSDVPFRDAEVVSDTRDVEQRGQLVSSSPRHRRPHFALMAVELY